MDLAHILHLIGGIGLFLYGMKYMGSSLERLAGARLEKTLEKVTKRSRSAASRACAIPFSFRG